MACQNQLSRSATKVRADLAMRHYSLVPSSSARLSIGACHQDAHAHKLADQQLDVSGGRRSAGNFLHARAERADSLMLLPLRGGEFCPSAGLEAQFLPRLQGDRTIET
jgi:hypothetical protein